MMEMENNSYKLAGVDVTAGYESVKLMKADVKRTHNSAVLGGIGGFGGMYLPDLSGMSEPVLVSGTDGVGTKLKAAFILDKHDTIGIDLVAMCVNDIICCGAKPLFFLDYINCGKNNPEKIALIIKGIADGCVKAGCALIGGETAEHPDLTPENEYDLAGFCTGVVDKSKIIEKTAKKGDVLIGIASSGIHSNGFSLIRKVFDLENTPTNLNKQIPELSGKTLGETLLTPTEIYVSGILSLISEANIKGIANITGGGFYENIPRCLPGDLGARIDKNSYKIPAIFEHIRKCGSIPEKDMYGTFNMGIGMIVTVDKSDVDNTIRILSEHSLNAFEVGEVTDHNGVIIE